MNSFSHINMKNHMSPLLEIQDFFVKTSQGLTLILMRE